MKNMYRIKHTVVVALLLLGTTAVFPSEKSKLTIPLTEGVLSVEPLNGNAVRVRLCPSGTLPQEELIYTQKVKKPRAKVREDSEWLTLQLPEMTVAFQKSSQTLTFYNAQKQVLLQEKPGGRLVGASTVQGTPTFSVEQQFLSSPDEYLFGTGQFQDGYLNIKGLPRRLTQVNTQISIPFVLSNKGYGLLWNNYGLTDFNPCNETLALLPSVEEGQSITVNATGTQGNKRETRSFKSFMGTLTVPADGTYALLLDMGQRMARKYYLAIDGAPILDVNNLWLPPTTSCMVNLSRGSHAIEVRGVRDDKPLLSWRALKEETTFRSPVAQALDYTVFAGIADEVIASYRQLTGAVPMPPRWALGYIHCRERYNTQAELLENAAEFRKRQLPVDVIVQDWQWWGKYGWNAMRFDEDRYPNPADMVEQLHRNHLHLMLSVWSKIDRNSELGKEVEALGYYIPGTDWIDFFNPQAAAFYWKNFSEKLLRPYAIDAWWQDATEPENDDLLGRRINAGKDPGECYRNVYPLFVNRTVYEGLRQDDSNRRPLILTRCAFSGMQRYGVVTWSGDVGNDMETLRRQLAGGLGQMATGLPWWTYDAGGFFRPGNQYTDAAYQERLVRWVEASAFLPFMRVHGYQSQTEPWRYNEQTQQIMAEYMNLRYRLLPYIYSQVARVSQEGYTLMRPLVFDYPRDVQALQQTSMYLFGPSLLVNPVTEEGVDKWPTYLPEEPAGWYDFWTNKWQSGGHTVEVPVTLDRIPVFVKAGSILPMGPVKQYTSQVTDDPLSLHIYPGADAMFTLYEDEGENLHYQQQAYSTVVFRWNETQRTLSIAKRKGKYEGMEVVRTFRVCTPTQEKVVTYTGKPITVQF